MQNLKHTLIQPVRGSVEVPFARIWRAVVAELIGTMFFTFVACASVTASSILNITDKSASIVLAAFAQGLAIMAMVSVNGKISGGHINPAVTFSLVVVRSMNWVVGLYYILAQCVGSVLGAALFKGVVTSGGRTLGSTVPGPHITGGEVFLMEFMITSILIYTVLGTALHGDAGIKPLAPIPIGFAVVVGVLIAGLITGGSMNPARSFGPAVISNTWTYHYLYWLAPLASALVIGVLYKLVFLSLPLTESECKAMGLDLGASQMTLSPGHTTMNAGNGVGRGTHYLTAADAIDMAARNEEPTRISISTQQ